MACTHINEQGKILHRYLTKWNFISTHLHLQPTLSSYTYESDAHSTQSTLDHILCPKHMLSKIMSSYTIIEEPLNTSDHNPVFATMRNDHPSSHPPHGSNASSFSPPNWSASSKEDIHRLYTTPLQHSLKPLLRNMPLPSSLAHNPILIDHFLQSFTSALLSASTHIPSKSFHPHRSPGWNSSLKHASRVCKHHYRVWVAAGRPRDPSNPIRMAYKEGKKHFRSCLRLHRRLSAENFFASLDVQTTDPQRFFRAIRKHTSHITSHTQRLIHDNKVYDNDNIMDGWASYFESLSTPADVPFTEEQLLILESYYTTQSMPTDEPDLVSEEEVSSIIHSLPLKKAAGPDRITNEHLKFGGSVLPAILSSLFNAILISGHIPAPFKLGLIIPIPKSHNKDLSIPSNYRGITLLSVIAKVSITGIVVPHLQFYGTPIFPAHSVYVREFVRVPFFPHYYTHLSLTVCWINYLPLAMGYILMMFFVEHQCTLMTSHWLVTLQRTSKTCWTSLLTTPASGVTSSMPRNQQFWSLVNLQFHVGEIGLHGSGC